MDDPTFEVLYSASSSFPRYHITPECKGLEKANVDSLRRSVMTAAELASDRSGRPCRMCALAPVLGSVLSAPGPKVFVTFTSQSNPFEPCTNLRRYSWTRATESGANRLRALAADLGLGVTGASCGPVAYGMVPAEHAESLAWNLRTLIRDDVTAPPPAEMIECLWMLRSDDPPEVFTSAINAWETAAALTN